MASSFPQHLLDGYRAFTSQRLPTEQTRYRELSERGQSTAVMAVSYTHLTLPTNREV